MTCFWSKSGQFENGKKPKISTSTILTIFQLKTSRLAGSLDFRLFLSHKNGQNADLNHQNVEFGGPLKGPRMNFHITTTDFYVQEYRDITLNTKLGKLKT